jgi:large subunit ribosomal protein L6
MSRIGKKPIPVADSVTVTVSGRSVTVNGPNGELSWSAPQGITISHDAEAKQLVVARSGDDGQSRAFHGLSRSLISNMVTGVVTPFEKRLEVHGVGYQATLNNNTLSLNVGYSHSVDLPVPAGVECALQSPTLIIVRSSDKQAAGQFAANIRAARPPEPYKGKGVRYQGEYVRRKAGKAFGAK